MDQNDDLVKVYIQPMTERERKGAEYISANDIDLTLDQQKMKSEFELWLKIELYYMDFPDLVPGDWDPGQRIRKLMELNGRHGE